MDPKLNPYSPGAGVIPPELVGRDELLANTEIALERILLGKSERNIMFHGVPGVGKTVLLNELEERAKKYNAITEYHEVKFSDYEQSQEEISRLVQSLDQKLEREIGFIKRISNVPKKFIQNLTNYHDTNVDTPSNLQINAETKEIKFANDLTVSFFDLGKRARNHNFSILILIDEIQDLNAEVNQALISAIHRANQKNLPLMVIGAGLPNLVENLVNSKTYVERLFKFHNVGSLDDSESKKALIQPALNNDVLFDDAATNEIFEQTKGYPYFIQTWGFHSWNNASQSPITLTDVQGASDDIKNELDESFFRARFSHLTDMQKKYIKAIANLESKQPLAREEAKKMVCTTGKLCEIKNQLIKKGIIYSPENSRVSFSVPLFDEFLNRTEIQ